MVSPHDILQHLEIFRRLAARAWHIEVLKGVVGLRIHVSRVMGGGAFCFFGQV